MQPQSTLVFIVHVLLMGIGICLPSKAQWGVVNSVMNGVSLYGVSYGNGQWVTVGGLGKILSSSDGISWTTRASNTDQRLSGISYKEGKWVAVGSGGIILTSLDGINWVAQASGTAEQLNSVSYGGGQWIAVGQSANVRVGKTVILTSPDAITWTQQATNTSEELNYVTYRNNLWMIVGGNGKILTSTDGITWTSQMSNTVDALNTIEFAVGQWIVGSNGGKFLTSPDGIAWTVRSSGTVVRIFGISYSNEHWEAVGGPSADGVNMLTSPDALSWTATKSAEPGNLYSIFSDGSRGVSVGDFTTILTNPAAPLGTTTSFSEAALFYPNPSSGAFTIEDKGGVSAVTIYSLIGVQLQHHSFNEAINKWTFSSGNLPAGLYLLKVQSPSGQVHSLRWIKQ